MADLIVKFFQEEMTQAEEQALSDRLLSSTEEALRFGEQAEKAYLGFGLPEPHWPGGGPPSAPWTHGPIALKPLIWAGALLTAGLTGLILWRHHPVNQPVPMASIAPAPVLSVPVQAVTHPLVKKKPAPAISLIAARPVFPIPLTPVSTPIELTANPSSTFSNLSVMVRRSSPGKVRVTVLKPDATTAVLLYEGPLKSGKWIFDWDGKLADGQMAPPGFYRIQVESGPVVQDKTIVVR